MPVCHAFEHIDFSTGAPRHVVAAITTAGTYYLRAGLRSATAAVSVAARRPVGILPGHDSSLSKRSTSPSSWRFCMLLPSRFLARQRTQPQQRKLVLQPPPPPPPPQQQQRRMAVLGANILPGAPRRLLSAKLSPSPLPLLPSSMSTASSPAPAGSSSTPCSVCIHVEVIPPPPPSPSPPPLGQLLLRGRSALRPDPPSLSRQSCDDLASRIATFLNGIPSRTDYYNYNYYDDDGYSHGSLDNGNANASAPGITLRQQFRLESCDASSLRVCGSYNNPEGVDSRAVAVWSFRLGDFLQELLMGLPARVLSTSEASGSSACESRGGQLAGYTLRAYGQPVSGGSDGSDSSCIGFKEMGNPSGSSCPQEARVSFQLQLMYKIKDAANSNNLKLDWSQQVCTSTDIIFCTSVNTTSNFADLSEMLGIVLPSIVKKLCNDSGAPLASRKNILWYGSYPLISSQPVTALTFSSCLIPPAPPPSRNSQPPPSLMSPPPRPLVPLPCVYGSNASSVGPLRLRREVQIESNISIQGVALGRSIPCFALEVASDSSTTPPNACNATRLTGLIFRASDTAKSALKSIIFRTALGDIQANSSSIWKLWNTLPGSSSTNNSSSSSNVSTTVPDTLAVLEQLMDPKDFPSRWTVDQVRSQSAVGRARVCLDIEPKLLRDFCMGDTCIVHLYYSASCCPADSATFPVTS
ncbi:hypothetical protein VOLCADRAFT_98860 [Volvox carteri f. nagariensis]|uniref:Pherophorin domain-containing protein n=1 Tax=Volvox carteri f. nagariensis TaxID=3068 RepID=D8UGG8_VOLCA|nr:uncharacterized protein VOLCADRAFT_98860 [Volvox carteri f. nagariensis]EFJ41197.1 hypothetical protein VOLCADRAFT_98860 [Volvox carteri f. nagariensis]|eukprot:XP_002957765.1 hypothetical protein VOLCADRAFT_98860 [Volvox carteri f. nagariensis]